MPAGVSAYVALANVTLGSSASSVTFSSISQAYRDLVLVSTIKGNPSTFVALYYRFNGDSGSNYNMVNMRGSGGATGSTSAANVAQITMDGNDVDAVSFTQSTLNIMDYTATDKHKTALLRNDNAILTFNATQALAGRWANTAAITSITVLLQASVTLAAGSTFALYGIAS